MDDRVDDLEKKLDQDTFNENERIILTHSRERTKRKTQTRHRGEPIVPYGVCGIDGKSADKNSLISMFSGCLSKYVSDI